jgi:predicted HTH transcriptional regulator
LWGLPAVRPTCHAVRAVQTPKMTAQELREHLKLLDVASRDDLDELLTDLLCHAYRSKDAQNG